MHWLGFSVPVELWPDPDVTAHTEDSGQLRTLLEEVHDRRLSVGWVRGRISVDLPRVAGGFPPVCRHPFSDRVVRLIQILVWPAVDGNGNFALRRFGCVDLTLSFKCARDLDTEVAEYRRARPRRVMVDENVVAVSPQPRLAANELPDLAQSRPPRRANRARHDLAPHRGQLAGVNSLNHDGDGHSSNRKPKS